MNSATDWLANISVKWILVVAGLLLVMRMSLPRMRALPRQWADSTAEFVESALIAIVLVFLIIRPFVVQAFFIPSASMMNTLLIQDHILVNKFLFHFRPPTRRDIVVFHAPKQGITGVQVDPAERDWIKRLIGRPGETIQVFPDAVLVDGKRGVQIINENEATSARSRFQPNAEQHGLLVSRISTPDGATDSDPVIRGHTVSFDGEIRVAVTPSGRAEARDQQLWIEGQRVGYASGLGAYRSDGNLAPLGAEPGVKGTVYYLGQTQRQALIVLKGGQLSWRPGYVTINGKPQKEPYIRHSPRYEMPAYHVPQGTFFMMGDNRNDSDDSHAWGPLVEDRIIGKAMFIFWPLRRLRLLN